MQTNHIKSNESTTPGPQPNLKEFTDTNLDWAEVLDFFFFFFKYFKYLRSLVTGGVKRHRLWGSFFFHVVTDSGLTT